MEILGIALIYTKEAKISSKVI